MGIRPDECLSGAKEEMGAGGNWVWQLKGKRNPCGDRTVLYLDCVNVTLLVIVAYFCKILSLRKTKEKTMKCLLELHMNSIIISNLSV